MSNYTEVRSLNKSHIHGSARLYNPKSHAPALYIPNWLSQVSSGELSYSAKIVYGRLAQWSQANGTAHRSATQISIEVGMPQRTVKGAIKELKDVALIGTHQPFLGGHNHFEFYHHEWMDRPIVRELCYKSDIENEPSADIAHPSADIAHPSADIAQHKIEINKKKNNIKKKEKINKKEKESIGHEDEGLENKKVVQHEGERKPSNKRGSEMAKYRETLYESDEQSNLPAKHSSGLCVSTLEELNPHNIPIGMIRDWLTVRASKKSPVTATAWSRLNKQLSQCKDPIEAFEIMVTHGWSSLNHKWIDNVQGKQDKNMLDDELNSTEWINRI